MLDLSPHLLDRFLVIDVHDPDELAHDSAVSRRFPSSNNSHRYRLAHRPVKSSRSNGAQALMRLAMCPVGDLMAAYVADRHPAQVEIAGPGIDQFCLSVMLAGTITLRTPARAPVQSGGPRGLVLRGEPGHAFETSEGNARFNLWVQASRVESTLVSLLGRPLAEPLRFEPGVDLSEGAGASLLRLIDFLARDLARPDGVAGNPLALGSFTDLWVQTLLQGLPHNYREALSSRHHPSPVPGHVKRAEAFMRANVSRAVTLTEVAEAAGCSLRTLHGAFRRFRDITPLAALHGIRLDAAKAVLEAEPGRFRPAEVARRHGFTNAGRFRTAYLRRFGVAPPKSRG